MLKDFREIIAADLCDPEFQRELISAAYEEAGDEGVIMALREIASASRSMTKVARSAGVARTTLYRSFSQKGNPAFKTVRAALTRLGLTSQSSARTQQRGDAWHSLA